MLTRLFRPAPRAAVDTHTPPDHAGRETAGLHRRVLLIGALCLVAVGLVTWRMVYLGQQRVIEHQALEVAEVVARSALSARSVYTSQIVEKLARDGYGSHAAFEDQAGFVPLPAQFLKMFGRVVSRENDGLFSYKPVSKWNIEPTQYLADDFLRWAWPQLEAQDQTNPTGPIAWKPVWRIEQVNGQRVLRYLRADAASAQSCVTCHNAHELMDDIRAQRVANGVVPGKQFKLHQLLGAIDVSIPLDKVEVFAAAQNRVTLAVIIGVAGAGVLILGFLISLDVTRSRRMARELSWQANHDSLTGLASRTAFERRAEQLLREARSADAVHALLFMDLDQFKLVNDTSGHTAGDELLRELGMVLKGQIRANDMLARLGGDEFGLLLERCPPAKAIEIAEKLHAAVQNFRFLRQGKRFSVGISIGMCQITPATESIATVMSQADLACYAAKDAGRNRIHVFSPTDADITRRRSEMEWVSRVSRAHEEGRISLAVQDARRLNGEGPRQGLYRELLLRMVDEDGKPVAPATLIAAAERFNFMPTIDRWVVKTAFAAIARGDIAIVEGDVVAINLSGTSLNDDHFLDFIREQVRQLAPGRPQQICFEITETAAISSVARARDFIETVRLMGCKFALDDFGSGSSSLTYIRQLPLDFLKIEGSFVQSILTDPVAYAMVDAVCHIGRAIHATLVAEWVETDALLARVREMGIDYAQGFAVGPVVPLRLNRSGAGLPIAA
ncbi:MAG TPA: EAL domain-containing protein [Burkholderiales bacterium]|nr:EAL domain-containing protein [Burkholderiales bacterium]